MKHYLYFLITFLVFCNTGKVCAQEQVECWGQFELVFQHHSQHNPFDDKLSAIFVCGEESKMVYGFYDGDNTYRIRFMPTIVGEWKYITSSNVTSMNKRKGQFTVVAPGKNNHGPVVIDGLHNFKYADGTRYYPMGTTSYAWVHMQEDIRTITLKSLAKTSFNKIRMCVFPKNYVLVKDEPILYPFVVKEVTRDEKGDEVKVWDFERFNPIFFQHLEKCIKKLGELGIEADLILFHPYDKGRWGFDAMSNEVNVRYIKYITARLSSFHNVWWSVANEWDYVKAKTVDDWNLLTKAVVENDPYNHLCSIHGATATYFDYWRPEFTHVSIQDENPVQTSTSAALLWNIYRKPVICDEVGYEGNLSSRWGRLSAQQMIFLILNGIMGGIYVTHGECLQEDDDPIFWAQGGLLKGESWQRVGFLKEIMEAAPNPIQMADISRDMMTSTAGDGYYFVYFGKEVKDYWLFNLPVKNTCYERPREGQKFKVDIIDVWNMTTKEYPITFEVIEAGDYRVYDKKMRGVKLPGTPYVVLRIMRLK